MKIPLKTPFDYEDQHLTEIDLDLEGKVTPRLSMAIEAEFRRKIKGEMVPLPMMDGRFQFIVMRRITGYSEELLLALPFDAFNIMKNAVQIFFMNSEEPSTETSEEPEG